MLEAIRILCKEIKILCYEPTDRETSLMSLIWLETIQYMDEGCLEDVECIENLLESFGYSLSFAIKYEYHIQLDLGTILEKLYKTAMFSR